VNDVMKCLGALFVPALPKRLSFFEVILLLLGSLVPILRRVTLCELSEWSNYG
jgi:hypothetical protein